MHGIHRDGVVELEQEALEFVSGMASFVLSVAAAASPESIGVWSGAVSSTPWRRDVGAAGVQNDTRVQGLVRGCTEPRWEESEASCPLPFSNGGCESMTCAACGMVAKLGGPSVIRVRGPSLDLGSLEGWWCLTGWR